MALNLSGQEQKVIMACELRTDFSSDDENKVKVKMALDENSTQACEELSEDKSHTSHFLLKGSHGETALKSNLSSSPSKRQKMHDDVIIGEQEEPQNSVTKGEEVFNNHGDEKMHDVIGEQGPQNSVTTGEEDCHTHGDGDVAAGGDVGVVVAPQSGPISKVEEMTPSRDVEGNNEGVRSGQPLPAADAKEIGDESRRERMSIAQMLQQRGSDDASLEDADEEEENDDAFSPRSSTSDDSSSSRAQSPHFDVYSGGGYDDDIAIDDARALVTASVNRSQQNDPELRKKLHELEIGFDAGRISREQYNDKRWELYSEEEAKAGRILWPRPDVHSPAGYMDRQGENWSIWNAGDELDDALWRAGMPFKGDRAEKEEAANQRLFVEIENKFKDDPKSKAAEYKRWEKIRELEIGYLYKRIARNKYDKRRIALYTQEERDEILDQYEIRVQWPNGPVQECYSPAGYRDYVFERYDDYDFPMRLHFHYPVRCDSDEAEKLCELCIPLKEKQEREDEEREKRMREEAVKTKQEWEERKNVAKPIPCVECSKRFASEEARRQHSEVRHRELLEKAKPEKRPIVKPGSKQPYICAECFREFGTEKGWRRHTKNVHWS
ncbi:unnamed protein product [Calypogeia fissa]